MKSSEEFKSEVYRLAEVKQKQIKLRNRRIAVVIPCIAVVILTAAFSVGFLDLPVLTKSGYDSAPPEGESFNNVDGIEVQNDFEANTAGDDSNTESAGNQSQKPGDQAVDVGENATNVGVDGVTPYAEAMPAGDLTSVEFISDADPDAPQISAQVIDTVSELEKYLEYLEDNNCDTSYLEDNNSSTSAYRSDFKWIFLVAVSVQNSQGSINGVNETDDALQINLKLNQTEESEGKACHILVPFLIQEYDKTKRIEIIKN